MSFPGFPIWHKRLTRLALIVLLWAVSGTAAQESGVTIPANASVNELMAAAAKAGEARNFKAAIALFKEILNRQPRHEKAWNGLGYVLLQAGKYKDAEAAFRKQIEINEFDGWAYNNLGLALDRQGRQQEAEAMFRKQLEINPLDEFAHANLGRMYMMQYHASRDKKKLHQAIESLETASRIRPKEAGLRLALGFLYVEAGEKEKGDRLAAEARAEMPPATAAFSGGDPLSSVFLSMKPVEEVIPQAEAELSRIAAKLQERLPEEAQEEDENASSRISYLWVMLAEAYQRNNEPALAEAYLLSAWQWTQSGSVADRLGQMYERQGQKQKAIQFYRRALAASPSHRASQDRLNKLTGGKAPPANRYGDHNAELSNLRSVDLGKSTRKGSGEFTLTLRIEGSMVKVEGVRFVSGDSGITPIGKNLLAAKFQLSAPAGEVRMMRRVMVYCGMGQCNATLMPAEVAVMLVPQ